MPVYNAERFLVESINSILHQTYRNIELIIIDDASTDGSWKIISGYRKRYPRIVRAFRMNHNLNRGGDTCANIGIQKAKGTYIARMDADDIAVPIRIQKQVAYLEKHTDVFMVGASAFVINGSGAIVGTKLMPKRHADIFSEYMTFHPMIHPTVMFRNNVIKRKCFYKQVMSTNNDYYTFFELINKGYRFANIADKLLYYRIYGHNDSLKNIKKSFINTIKTRYIMATKYNYPVTVMQILKSIAQAGIVFLLPEKITYALYLLSRRIFTLSDVLDMAKHELSKVTQPSYSVTTPLAVLKK